ncbi:MAG: hypothetical protein LUE14_11645, partial [Clostridiales bacterium]|nr:hypothetical protein [Clostridiales bacterium]
MKKRCLAVLLAAAMCFTMTSTGWAATDDNADTVTADETSADEESDADDASGSDETGASENGSAASVSSSGECGENLTWTLYSDGVLTISGSGAMEDYSSTTHAPWYSSRKKIKSIVIEDG